MQNKYYFFLCLFFFSAVGFGQQTYKSNQIILQFTPDATQSERQGIIDQLGTLAQDEDGDPSFIDDLVLVRISQFPVTVNGVYYQDEVELTGGIHDNLARLDESGLNYNLQQPQTQFDAPLGDFGGTIYSPVSPACEASYPGGSLQASDFGGNQTTAVSVAILDSGLDPYYDFINQYVVGAVDVTMDDNGEDPIRIQFPYDLHHPVARDVLGHGTAVAGIITGLANRANVPPASLDIIPIKCFNDQGEGELFNVLQALRLAHDLGANIMNLSWSYATDNPANLDFLKAQLNALSSEGEILLVASAGNDGLNLTDNSVVPASLSGINNLITVAATSSSCDGSLASFSNYGSPVDLAAPGERLVVPGVNGLWSTEASGTSFATPIVTAAAVQTWLCLAARGQLATGSSNFAKDQPVRTSLLLTAVPTASLQGFGIPGVVSFTDACNFTGDKTKLLDQTSQEQEVRQPSEQAQFTIAPNPFSEQLQLRVSDNELITSINIYATNGARVFSKNYPTSPTTTRVEISALPVGLYSLRVRTNRKTYTRKIIKQ